jgi:hypothetical protein
MPEWKNVHSGERLFILGNGPSLNQTPLEKLTDEYTMAMNQINLIYDQTKWRPDYFVFTNTNVDRNVGVSQDRIENARETIDSGVDSFVRADGKRHFGEKENIKYFPRVENKTYQSVKAAHNENKDVSEVWSDDITDVVYQVGSTIYTAAQVASYMGFDEIFLVGCDLWKPRSLALFDRGSNIDEFKFNSNSFIGRTHEYLLDVISNPVDLPYSIANAIFYKSYDILPSSMKHDPNHFSDDYQPLGTYTEQKNKKMRDIHRLMHSASKKYDFKIYNATLGGYLEVHQRVDIRNIL